MIMGDEYDQYNVIRSCSSSIVRAHSWSFGVGAQVIQTEQSQISLSNSEQGHDRSENLNPFRKLSIEIPTVYLIRGRGSSTSATSPSSSSQSSTSSSYHVYQINLRTECGHEWSIYRRYSQFHSFHHKLKAKDHEIGKLKFPPKRRLNSKASTIVQDRRVRLEEYMRCLISYIGVKLQNDNSVDGDQQLRDTLTHSCQSEVRAGGPSPSGRGSLSDSACSEPSNGSEISRQTDQQDRPAVLDVARGLSRVRPNSCNEELTVGCLIRDFLGLKEKQTESLDTGN